jgi:translation elongation factor EF-4
LPNPSKPAAIQLHAQAQASGEAEGRQEEERQFGKVDIPQEAFIAALKADS